MNHRRTGMGAAVLLFALAGCGGPQPASTPESEAQSTTEAARTAGSPLGTKNMAPVAGQ